MAYAYVNANNAENAASGSDIAVTLNGVTAGHLLVVCIQAINTNSVTISSVADDASGGSNTYSPVEHIYATNIPWRQWMYYSVVATGGNLTITATYSGATGGERAILVMEFSGPAASPLDGTNYTTADAAAGGDGVESIGPLTPSASDCMVVAQLADATGTDYSTPTGGFTLQQQTTNGISNCAQFYLIQSGAASAATCGATAGADGGYCGVMAVFTPAAAAPAADYGDQGMIIQIDYA